MRTAWFTPWLAGCTAIFGLHSAPNVDRDSDGVEDPADNCPDAFNKDQADIDGDGVGDACDECLAGAGDGDLDGDGVPDACDACDNRDADSDGDGIPDNCDVCANTGADVDMDGVDDGCDLCLEIGNDSDHDGIDDGCDPCVGVLRDGDSDGIDDACDPCDGPQHDEDGDGFLDACRNCGGAPNNCDNCPHLANPDQLDTTEFSLLPDGVGDMCDLGPARDTQEFDGFSVQNAKWYVTGSGWTILGDQAELQSGLAPSWRSLSVVHDVFRITTTVQIAGFGSSSYVEIFAAQGAPAPTSADRIECRITYYGQVSLLIVTGGTGSTTDSTTTLAATATLTLEKHTDGTVKCAGFSPNGQTAAVSGAVALTGDFTTGIGGMRAPVRFDYFDAVSGP